MNRTLKSFVAALAALAMAAALPLPAGAGGYKYGKGYGYGYKSYGYGGYGYRGYGYRKYGYGYPRAGYSFGYYGHGSDAAIVAGAVVGGLLLGSLLTRRAYGSAPKRRHRTAVVAPRPVLGNCKPTTGESQLNGRRALYSGTWCTDQYGQAYILDETVRFVGYLE